MKLPRLWPDALRHTRLMTWAPVFIPVLVFLTLADRWYPDYAEHRERHADTEMRVARAQAVADLQPRYEEKIAAQTDAFNTATTTALVNEQVDASIAQLRQHIQSILTAEFVDEVPQFDITAETQEGTNGNAVGPAVLLRVTLRLLVSPQQLAGLEARLLPLKDRLVPVEMELKVVPDPKRASQQLEVQMRFHALHLDAPAVAETAPAPSGAAAVPSAPAAPQSTK